MQQLVFDFHITCPAWDLHIISFHGEFGPHLPLIWSRSYNTYQVVSRVRKSTQSYEDVHHSQRRCSWKIGMKPIIVWWWFLNSFYILLFIETLLIVWNMFLVFVH